MSLRETRDIYGGAVGRAREVAYDKFVQRHLKRNYAGHFIHGVLGLTGWRLVNTPTFVPAYLHLLSGSDIVVGAGLALQQLGGAVSPILGAIHIEHRKRVLPVSMMLGTLMRLPILGMALAGWLLHGPALLITVLFLLFLLGLFSGPQGVAFQYLLAKMIPIRLRGRLQGWRNMTGGLVAAALSYVAGRYLVGHDAFGNGYGTTFLAGFVLTSAGLTAFALLVSEPELPTLPPKTPIGERMRKFRALLAGDQDFLFFMIARTFAIANRIAAPFYIVYASRAVPLSGSTIGVLSFAYLIADTATNLIWGHLSDRSGFRATLVAALFLWIAATALLIYADSLPLIFIAFFGLGAGNAGYQMSAQNIVFEFGHRDDMAMRLAVSNAAESAMGAVGPLTGGLLATSFGYMAVFGGAITCEAIALVILLTLVKEPRHRWRA